MKKPRTPGILSAMLGIALIAFSIILFTSCAADDSPAVSEPVISDSQSEVSISDTAPSSASDVSPVYAEDILFDLQYESIAVGHGIIAEITLSPPDTNYDTIIWESSNKDVAIVDQNGCITAVSPGQTYISVRSGNVERGQWLNVVQPGLVYISPSSDNEILAVGDICEKDLMLLIAKHCVRRLEQCGVSSHIASEDLNYIARSSDAAEKGADIYIALQTCINSAHYSTSAYYHLESGDSFNLAYHTYCRISSISPSEGESEIHCGLPLELTEIMYPHEQAGIPSAILAIENRMRIPNAQWMIDNAETIGIQIAEGILDYYAVS